jgi:hypothetical protein
MKKTRDINQQIAASEARTARLKSNARKARTRQLIIAGSYLEPYLEKWQALTEDQRKNLADQLGRAIHSPAAASTPGTHAPPTGREEK